jgi:phospholipid/cholesterol/gamma-HCH transport system substrate-binding protein
MKRRSDLAIGGVVLVVALALTAALVWIQQADIRGRHRDVVVRTRDAGGVRVGNDVVIQGVRRGRIDRIELARDGWVHIGISLEPDVELPASPVVLLNEASVFGEWQATIADERSVPRDAAVAQQIREASESGGFVPGVSLPGISRLTGVAGEIAGDIASVAGRVDMAFDEAAARELRASIRNFSRLSATLSGVVTAHATDLDSLSAQLGVAVASLGRTSAATERAARRVDSAMTDVDPRQITRDVAAAAADLRAASSQVRAMSVRFAASEARLAALLARGDSVMVKINAGHGTLGLMINDPSLYRNSDMLAVTLRELAADVRANPKRYLTLKVF